MGCAEGSSEKTMQVRVEWGFPVPAMPGFAANLPAAPGGPVDGDESGAWFTGLSGRGAEIEAAEEQGLADWGKAAGECAWESHPSEGDTGAVVATCRFDPTTDEPLLVVRTSPTEELGFCINLNHLSREETIYAPAVGYFFSAHPAMTHGKFLKQRRELEARIEAQECRIPDLKKQEHLAADPNTSARLGGVGMFDRPASRRTIPEIENAPEQTYAGAYLLGPHTRQTRSFLGWPAFTEVFGAYRNGDLFACSDAVATSLYRGDHELTLCLGTGLDPDFRRTVDAPHHQEMPDGRTLTTRWTTDGLAYEQEAFAFPLMGADASPAPAELLTIDHTDPAMLAKHGKEADKYRADYDAPAPPALVAMLRYRIANPSSEKRVARIWFSFTGTGYCRLAQLGLAELGELGKRGTEKHIREVVEDDYHGDLRLDGEAVRDGERIRCKFEAPDARLKFHDEFKATPKQKCETRYQIAEKHNLLKNIVTVEMDLEAKSVGEIILKVPYFPIEEEEAERLDALRYEQTKKLAGEHWEEVLAGGMQVSVPEELVNQVYRSFMPHVLPTLDTDADGTVVPKCSPLWYEYIWHLVTCPTTVGMDWTGYHEWARACLDALLPWHGYRKPEGEFLSAEGHFGIPDLYNLLHHCNTNGMLLWAVAEHYRYTRDDEWLKGHADTIAMGCDWIIRERRGAMEKLGDPGALGYGMLPVGRATDSGIGRYLFTDTASCNGLLSAGRVLKEVGHPEAERIDAEARGYREDLRRAVRQGSARRALVQLKDKTWIPFVPVMLDGTKRDADLWYANQVDFGPMWMMEYGILEHDSPWVDYLLNDHEDNLYRHGLADESYVSCQYLPYLLRGETRCYVRALYNQLFLGMDPHNLVRWEHRSQGEAAVYGLTNAEGEFCRRIVQGLLLMVDDDIWIASGTPRRWLGDGLEISVTQAPTYYGPMDFAIRSETAKGTITAEITPPRRNPFGRIRLHLRHPDQARMQRVEVNGKDWADFDPDREAIFLQPTCEPLQVVAHY